MKFATLLAKYDNDAIWDRLISLYPDQAKGKEGYYGALGSLRSLKPKKCGLVIMLDRVSEDGEDWVWVDGVEDGTNYAIEYVEWAKWLGMKIAPATLEEFAEVDILAHCLWEMTFSGFDEGEIQGEMEELNKMVDSILKNEANGKL